MLEVKLKNGETARVWCTFGPQQIDINPFSKFGAPASYQGSENLHFVLLRYELVGTVMSLFPSFGPYVTLVS